MVSISGIKSAVSSATNKVSSAMKSAYSKSDPLSSLKNPMTKKDPELHFPEELDEIDHFMTIRAFETKQISRREPTRQEQLSSIRLPIPGNLATAYNINYVDNDFVGLGNFVLEAFSEGGSQADREAINRALTDAGLSAVAGAGIGAVLGGNPILGAVAGVSGSVLLGGASQQAGLNTGAAANAIDTTGAFGAGILGNAGVAINPHKVLMFQNVGFRTHQFSYQFTPKSYREAVALKEIIYMLKYHSSPSFPTSNDPVEFNLPQIGIGDLQTPGSISADLSAGKHFFKYPDYFTIEFSHPSFLFSIGPSVIESFNVDYHPTGMPTYNREGGAEPTPTQVNISLTFKETEIITKETVKKLGR